MSNERIDLTQFEGMTEGTWHFCLPYNAETDTYEGDAQMKGGGDRVNGPVILSQYQFARGTVDQRADLRAMESCPELIAELKKRYEEIDGLLETIGGWGYVICPRSNEWFEWDYGCQSEKCASFDDDCRELVEASE